MRDFKDPRMQKIYAIYWQHGETPGYLHSYLDSHYNRGKLGLQEPSREYPAARAAWLAGNDRAKFEAEE